MKKLSTKRRKNVRNNARTNFRCVHLNKTTHLKRHNLGVFLLLSTAHSLDILELTQNAVNDHYWCNATETLRIEYDDRYVQNVYVAQGNNSTQTCTFMYTVREYI